MDKTAMEVADKYEKAKNLIPVGPAADFAAFKRTPEYDDVIAFLNIQELIAVGIHARVLDEAVCFDFYADDLMDACQHCQGLITYLQREDQKKFPLSYVELERLSEFWKGKNENLLRAQRQREVEAAGRDAGSPVSRGA
jgi:Domain of unknown function (DUF4760)